MKYDQLNFVVAVDSKSEEMTARMNEVFETKLTLAQYFINSGYKFAIIGQDIVSNEPKVGVVFNLIVSVVPQSEGIIGQIDEGHRLKTEMADVVRTLGSRCLIADEDMMSDLAKNNSQFLPKEI